MKRPSKPLEFVPYILMIFSIVECGVGLAISTFTETAITGSWWIIFFVIPVSWMVVLVDSDSSNFHITCNAICSAMTTFLLFSMMVVEAAWSSNLDLLVVCADTTTGEVFGDQKYADNTLYCYYIEGYADCSCAKTYADSYADVYSPNSTFTEVTDDNDYKGCLMFDTAKSNTCGEILTSYRDQVRVSVTLLALIFVGMVILTSAACNSCCNKEGVHRVTPSNDGSSNNGGGGGGRGGGQYVFTQARYLGSYGGGNSVNGGQATAAAVPTIAHVEVVRTGSSGFGGGFDGVRHEFLPPPENSTGNNYSSAAPTPTVVTVASPAYIDTSAAGDGAAGGSSQHETHDVVYVHATPI